MPVNEIESFTPLSKYFTHQDIVSRVINLTNQADNEFIQLDNVRSALRQSTVYIANLLNIAEKPLYGITLKCSLEDLEDAHTRLEYIDLSAEYTFDDGKIVIPGNHIQSIKRVSFSPTSDATVDMQETDWAMNAMRKDPSELTWLASQYNTEFAQSICWAHFGNKILFFVGNKIKTKARNGRTIYASAPYDVSFQDISIWAYRKPILDNMLTPNSTDAMANYSLNVGAVTPNMTAYVDIPDEYVELVVRMTQKAVLQQLKSAIPAELENEINAGIQQIQANIEKEIKLEAEEYDKIKYGIRQRGNQM